MNINRQSNYNGIFKYHSNRILKEAVKIANLKEGEIILDFGCEKQELKKFISNNFYIGYDIKKEYTDIESINNTNYNTIFFLNVLEHIDLDELKIIIKRNRDKKIIVCYPIESWISEIGNILFNNNNKYALTFFTHINRPREISKLLMEELGEPDEYKLINGTQLLAKWES